MTDSLDLSTPHTSDATGRSETPAAPEVHNDLVLTPPAPVPAVGTVQASSMMPIHQARITELTERARSFIDGLAGIDPRAPEFLKKVNDVALIGRTEIRGAAQVTNRMLQRPVAALAAARGAGDEADAQRAVASTLVELRLMVEDLDPSKVDGGIGGFLVKLLPFRDKLRSYFAKYASAQSHIDQIIRSLQNGQDELRKDNAVVEGEKVRLWETMMQLQEYAMLTSALDAQLVEQIDHTRVTDPERADALTADLLFTIRQKHQDLLTQLAVSAQGYLALDVVRKNNIELIKGVDRATTTTISALRTAVIVAQALANQKLVLDQITALNTTTSNLIVSTSQMLKSQSLEIADQSTSATISLDALETAFQNIYDTIDTVDSYKIKAVDAMAKTVDALETRLSEATDYLERASQDNPN